MQFRARFFGLLFLLSLGWLCWGFAASGNAFNSVVSTPVSGSGSLTTEDAQALRAAGAGIGASLGVGFFACTGLPFTLLFGLLAWRNQAGLTNKKRHEEAMQKKDEEIAALRSLKQ